MALGGAITQTSFAESVLFMTMFGIGTAPAMLLLGFSPSWLRLNTSIIKKAYPYAILFVAVLMLLRGMNLGIPYVSPQVQVTNECTVNCCHK
jgi:uncharacterized protein